MLHCIYNLDIQIVRTFFLHLQRTNPRSKYKIYESFSFFISCSALCVLCLFQNSFLFALLLARSQVFKNLNFSNGYSHIFQLETCLIQVRECIVQHINTVIMKTKANRKQNTKPGHLNSNRFIIAIVQCRFPIVHIYKYISFFKTAFDVCCICKCFIALNFCFLFLKSVFILQATMRQF